MENPTQCISVFNLISDEFNRLTLLRDQVKEKEGLAAAALAEKILGQVDDKEVKKVLELPIQKEARGNERIKVVKRLIDCVCSELLEYSAGRRGNTLYLYVARKQVLMAVGSHAGMIGRPAIQALEKILNRIPQQIVFENPLSIRTDQNLVGSDGLELRIRIGDCALN
jgi:hypothetical protein